MAGPLPEAAPGSRAARTDLVIFDFDGVLVDSEVISLATLRDTLRDYGADLSATEVRARFLGGAFHGIRDYLAGLPSPARPIETFERAWYDTLFARFRAELEPMPGALALLDRLDGHGTAYCIASSGSVKRLGVALAATGLGARFGDRVFSADMVARGKPAPDVFLHAARQMGVAPGACLVIEDSPAGAQAARAAGMRAIGFVGGSHLRDIARAHGDRLRAQHAQTVIDDLGAVPGYL
jgi:HAD superfamily hydrolase (TIGR01509 family)